MGKPSDHFSDHAAAYARARPRYPEALFDFLTGLPAARNLAWDCGAGSGQASLPLSRRFRSVLATDASAAQLREGPRAPRLLCAAAAAERMPLRDGAVDLVAVAQALHWFDFAAFFPEVRRVAKPGGAFAAWAYGKCQVSPEVDAVYDRLYTDIVGPYWPPERVHIERGYRDIPFPFPLLPAPPFAMQMRWNLPAYIGYLESWSAVQRFRRARGENPLELVRADLERAWGKTGTERPVVFPLILMAARL